MAESVLLIGIGLVIGAVVGWLLLRRGRGGDESFLLIQNQLNQLTQTLDRKLGESHEAMRSQIGESNKLIRDITAQITHVKETNQQVINIADQLKTLQNTLQNPKQRGVLGEYFLETVLKNVFPPGQFEMQYRFNDGEIVDAAIFFGHGEAAKILPVDSKFSLENYNRLIEESAPLERARYEKLFIQDIKNRISETAKYVRPEEKTFDFAFMFIPSEAIYYDLLVNNVGSGASERDLITYAFQQRVIIVSPTSFMAYLQTVLQGLKALKIEESVNEIRVRVEDLGRHVSSYEQYMKKLGGSLSTTVNHYNHAYRELKKTDKDVLKITGSSPGVDPERVDKPARDDDV